MRPLSYHQSVLQLPASRYKVRTHRVEKRKRAGPSRQSDAQQTASKAPGPSLDSTPVDSSRISGPATSSSEQRQRCVSPSLPDFALSTHSGNSTGKIVYMGDSGNMKYVIDEVGDPFKNTDKQCSTWGDNLQNYMVKKLGSATQLTMKSLRSRDEHHLKSIGAFDFPRKEVSDQLFSTFLEYSYPVFPLFNRADFAASHASGRLSPLVLNAIYMLASFHCPEDTLGDLGASSRYLACLMFYRRAKALYDADFESDSIATVQATILLANWWGGPMEQKDTWHWLGLAAGLAQALGMHRNKSYAILPPLQRSLWRRTWWVLYINDVHHAAVYGRPPHIHQDYCDIDLLHEADFPDYPADVLDLTTQSRSYLVHSANLASHVSRCLAAKFSPVHDPMVEQKSYQQLVDFENELEPDFRSLPTNISFKNGYWPALIHLYHSDYRIVFHRMLSATLDHNLTFIAATKINRILEDLLASGTLYRAPFMTLPAIFVSILVNIVHIRKVDSHTGIVAENRARLAMHVLANFEKIWPMAMWTRHLLDVLLKQSISPSLGNAYSSTATQCSETIEVRATQHMSHAEHHPQQQSIRTATSPQVERWGLSDFDAGNNQGTSSLEHVSPQPRFDYNSTARYAESPQPMASDMPLMFPMMNLFEDAGLGPDDWPVDVNVFEYSPDASGVQLDTGVHESPMHM
ncbi:hypothetical protein B0A52_00487 [Exophiala mesophila]|uniref:Xylanolytic transcriptional activator regulatory domain-containing protein n=1 Tax=Exophiala mesophila TaxID=212818 RepID=A0A438NK60_EXOME|nr:hypothetical protein B0A52_00487 [Exophiala mesophila]